MSFSLTRRRYARAGAIVASLALVIAGAGAALAGSGDPGSIHLAQTGPLSVTATGSWVWPEMLTNKKLSWAGYALDWGDVSSGNAVPKPGGLYHVGDGTAATNVVLHPTNPPQGASGTWGPVSHTYAKAGDYTVCVIIYDLGEVMPFKTTGYHSTRAGGPERNTDNSVEKNGDVTNNCATLTVTEPTPSPTPTPTPSSSVAGATGTPAPPSVAPSATQSVAGATGVPAATPPVTSTGSGSGSGSGVPVVVALVLFGLSALAAVVAWPRRDRG